MNNSFNCIILFSSIWRHQKSFRKHWKIKREPAATSLEGEKEGKRGAKETHSRRRDEEVCRERETSAEGETAGRGETGSENWSLSFYDGWSSYGLSLTLL